MRMLCFFCLQYDHGEVIKILFRVSNCKQLFKYDKLVSYLIISLMQVLFYIVLTVFS